MKIYLEAGAGFQNGTDVYGNQIVGSAPSRPTIDHLERYLKQQPEVQEKDITIVPTENAAPLIESMTPDDLLISVHLNFYKEPAAEGLRGFYRSTRFHNSEKSKALSITVTKALSDHTDLYYHGVYNEQRNRHKQLEPVVQTKALSAAVEVGFKEQFKNSSGSDQLHKNLATGIGLGVIRHLNARR